LLLHDRVITRCRHVECNSINYIYIYIYLYVFKVIKFVFISVVNKISQSSARDHMQYCCVTVPKKLSTLSSALKTHAAS